MTAQKRGPLRWVLPFVIVGAGVVLMMALLGLRQRPEPQPRPVLPPVVRTMVAEPQDLRLDVASSGEVVPRTETQLIAEVGGRVTEVSPRLAAGGFFSQGDVLARIDSRDYRIAVTQAKAQVAQAEVRFALEEGEAEIARRDWEALGSSDDAAALVLREPQRQEAAAALQSAKALLQQAELNLARTTIRAPYDGRVRARAVDVGQFVAPGTPLGVIFADDAAEIRLAIPRDEFGFLGLSLAADIGDDGPPVTVRAELGDGWREWRGRVVRVESVLDSRTRMFHAVARVDDPLRRRGEGEALPMGLFVEASIAGRPEAGVFVVPRDAVRDEGFVWVVEGDALSRRDVDVVRIGADDAVVRGLQPGDVVCTSALDLATEGMRVRPAGESAERPAAAEGDAA